MRVQNQRLHLPLLRCSFIAVSIGLILSSCTNTAQPSAVPSAPTENLSPTNQTVEETMTNSSSPTPTPTLFPVAQGNSSAAEAGLIIFSMSDGAYKHLFAYNPSYLPVTRLTSTEGDDESPAVSPDGNKIAYTSNQNGNREIYILDLVKKTLTQMTNSDAYEGFITWSPDGQYIAYDVYQDDHFVLMIQSVNDQSEALIQLTDGSSNSFQPAWSPDGSEIAFVSDQSGKNEIWLARLQSTDDLLVKCYGDSQADFFHPTWSPDGSSLAINQHRTDNEILIINPHDPTNSPVNLGNGKTPIWLPDGSGVLATLESPNQFELIAYSIKDKHLILPPIPMSGSISTYDWKAANFFENISAYLSSYSISSPSQLWTDQSSSESTDTNRRSLIALTDVNAPQALLSEAADDNFSALRELVKNKAGWDFLGTLENATLASTATSTPDIPENWLFTGRAIALNTAPYEAHWMIVTRENIAGETYWRVWIKCKYQDGSCGEPLIIPTWDFSSRYSGETLPYENGGEEIPAPSGYWVDFTELALRFGWERSPSLSTWRSYFPGILFNTYALKQGLTWQEALLDIYPPEQAELIIEKNQ